MRTTLLGLLLLVSTVAISQSSSLVFVRHDTSLLKAADCEWIIRSLSKNDPALVAETGKSIPLIILQSIEKGKLMAFNGETNTAIPAKDIYTWQIGADTVSTYDNEGGLKYILVQRRVNATDINLIRISQDWYFDVATGKLQTEVKWIELLQEVRTQGSGILIGNRAYCRIYY